MILKSIKLHNIRSYTTQKVEFQQGVTLLAGDIGSGKSTILLAIEFALFGLLRSMLPGEALLRKGKKSGFVELKFEIEKKEYVVHRQLKRTASSVVQGQGFMVFDGLQHDMTAVELKSKVLELLGYPRDLITKTKSLVYRYTVYTPQEQMKKILFEEREARLDTLRRVFGIDKYKRVVENAQVYTKVLRQRMRTDEDRLSDAQRIKGLKNQKQEDLLAIQDQSTSMKKVVDELQGLVKEKRELLSRAEVAVRHAIQVRAEAKAVQERFEHHQQQVREVVQKEEQVKGMVVPLAEEIASMKVEEGITQLIAERTSEFDDLKKEMDVAYRDLQEAQKRLLEAKNRSTLSLYHQKEGQRLLEDLTLRKQKVIEQLPKEELVLKDPAQITSQIKLHQQQKEEWRRAGEVAKQQVSVLSERIRQAQESIDALNRLDECPRCLQGVSHEHKESMTTKEEDRIKKWGEEKRSCDEQRRVSLQKEQEVQLQIQTLLEEEKELSVRLAQARTIESLKQELQKIEQDLDQKRKEHEDNTIMQKEAQTAADRFQGEVGTIQAVLDEQKKRSEDMMQIVDQLKQKEKLQIRKEEKQMRLNALLQQQKELLIKKEELITQGASLEQAKNALNVQAKELGEVEQEYAMIRKEASTLEEQLKQAEVKQAELMARSDDLIKGLQQIDEDLKRFKVLEQEMITKRKVQRWIDDGFVKMAKSIEKHVLHSVHAEFDGMFRRWFAMLIEDELLTARLDDTFSPIIEQNGYETEVTTLSGGEKTAAALAYRLALNKVINEMVGTIRTRDVLCLDEPTDGFSSEQLDKVREVLDELNLRQVLVVSHENKIESFVDNVLRVHKDNHVSRVTIG